jgi:hypothetical protein
MRQNIHAKGDPNVVELDHPFTIPGSIDESWEAILDLERPCSMR